MKKLWTKEGWKTKISLFFYKEFTSFTTKWKTRPLSWSSAGLEKVRKNLCRFSWPDPERDGKGAVGLSPWSARRRLILRFLSSAVTNGRHEFVPKDVKEEAEKYAKVSVERRSSCWRLQRAVLSADYLSAAGFVGRRGRLWWRQHVSPELLLLPPVSSSSFIVRRFLCFHIWK